MIIVKTACVLAILCYTVLIAVVFRRARRRAEARYFLFYLLGIMVWQVGMTLVAFTSNPTVAMTGYRLVAAFGISFGFFYAMFVRELVDVQSGRWLVPIGYALIFLTPIFTFIGGPGIFQEVYQEPGWPMFVPEPEFGAVILGVIAYGFLLYALYHLIRARRISTSSIERNRLAYLIIGVPVVILASAMNYVPLLRVYPIDMVGNVLNAGLTAFAIVRYRLLDIPVVIRKSLRYSVATLIISVIYFLLLSLAVQVLHIVAGYQVLMVSLVMAILAAVAAQPLRDLLQARVDKLFFREKYDTAQMLQRVSRSSAALLDIDELTEMILTEVTGSMRVERAAFFLKDETGDFRMAATRGVAQLPGGRVRADHPLVPYLAAKPQVFVTQSLDRLPLAKAFLLEEREQWEQLNAELIVPVMAKGSLIGMLAVGHRETGVDYGQDDHVALLTLANQTAIAVENARLYAAAQHQLAERRRAEAETRLALDAQQVLMREIHHRVKNNLQIIYSLLSLQSQYASDEATLQVLRDSQDRIRSMALIHEKLYQSANLANIDFGEYLRSLAAQLHRSYATNQRTVRLIVNTAPIRLALDVALPCALVASELIANALKHAFVGRREGLLRVAISVDEQGMAQMEVADDGVGMTLANDISSEGELPALRDPATLGMQLVLGLVRQLDGEMTISNGAGTRFLISFHAAGNVIGDVKYTR